MVLPILKEILKPTPKKKQTIKNSQLPIQSINDTVLGKDGYAKLIVQVQPINGDSLEIEEVEGAVESIRVAFGGWRGRIQILVTSEKVRVEKNIAWLNESQKKQDHDLYIDMIEEQKTSFEMMSRDLRTVNRFYLIIEGRGQNSESDLRTALGTMATNMIENGLDIAVMDREQNRRLFYEKLNPRSSLHQPYTADLPDSMLVPSKMDCDMYGHMVIDDWHFRHMAVTHYPTRPPQKYRWLSNLLRVNGNKTISFILNPRPVGQDLTKSIGAMVNRVEREYNTATTQEVRLKKKTELKTANRLYEMISNDNESIYDMTLIIEASGRTKEEMQTTYDNLQQALSGPRCFARTILIPGKNRFDAFYGCLPLLYRSNVTDKYYTWNMPLKTIASIMPFDSSEFQEESGIFFAENPINKSPYIFNRYNKALHDNPHGFTLGLPGSGKTFDEENEILREAPHIDHTIIFDPEREYFFTFGKRYNVAKNCTNPFHVRSPIIDSDNDVVDGRRHYWEATKLHIQNILPLFKFWMPELSSIEASMIEEDVREMYAAAGFHEEMTGFPDIFPTLNHYKAIAFAKVKETDSEEKPGRKRILATINQYTDGVYSSLVNGQTNWDFDDRVIIFDIHDLTSGVKGSIYFLLLLHTWQFIKESRQLGKVTKMIVDECHVLMNKNNVGAAEFLFNVNKRGRKYFVALQLITQNLLDFLGVSMSGGSRQESEITQYGTAIINNSRFKKIFRVGKLDLQELNNLYSFSKRERKTLSATKGRGKGIMIIGDTQRIEFQTKRLPHEEKYFNKGQYTA